MDKVTDEIFSDAALDANLPPKWTLENATYLWRFSEALNKRLSAAPAGHAAPRLDASPLLGKTWALNELRIRLLNAKAKEANYLATLQSGDIELILKTIDYYMDTPIPPQINAAPTELKQNWDREGFEPTRRHSTDPAGAAPDAALTFALDAPNVCPHGTPYRWSCDQCEQPNQGRITGSAK